MLEAAAELEATPVGKVVEVEQPALCVFDAINLVITLVAVHKDNSLTNTT